MAVATISFMDGTTISSKHDMTVREAWHAITPVEKMHTHLDICFQGDVLEGDDVIGARALQGVWRRVVRAPLNWPSHDDPHMWRAVVLEGGNVTGLRERIPTHSFHLQIVFEESMIFSKTIVRGIGFDEGYDPETELKLVFLQLREPNPGPSCHPDWATLYIDRAWVSREVGFWAHTQDCLLSCGVGPGTALTAYMERLDMNHETPAGDPEERRERRIWCRILCRILSHKQCRMATLRRPSQPGPLAAAAGHM